MYEHSQEPIREIKGIHQRGQIVKQAKGKCESDDDLLIEEQQQLQKTFRNTSIKQYTPSIPSCQNHPQSSLAQLKKHKQTTILQQDIIKPIEMMFIIFSTYKQELISIVTDYGCRIKISTNKLKITTTNSFQLQYKQLAKKFNLCIQQVIKYLEQINYIQYSTHQLSHRFYNSPYIYNKAITKYKFRMTKFNMKVYCYSRQLKTQQIKRRSRQLFGRKILFSVSYWSPQQKYHQIFEHITHYIKQCIKITNNQNQNQNNINKNTKQNKQQKQQQQQQQNIVEISRNQCAINCLGNKQREVLGAKNKVKNMLQSMNIIIIRYNTISSQHHKIIKIKQLIQYVRKVSKSTPIYLNKLHRKAICIISKDNILKSLFEKNKFLQLLQPNNKYQICMFFLKLGSYAQKKLSIQKICHKKGYDLVIFGNLYYMFKKVFMSENQQAEDIYETIAILKQSLISLRQIKNKWDTPHKINKRVLKFDKEEQLQNQEYYSTGQMVEHQELSDILRSDIMIEKCKMGKKSLIRYRVCQAQETVPVYWYIINKIQQHNNIDNNNEYDNNGIKNAQKIECKATQIQKQTNPQNTTKQYFIGKKKELGDEKYYFIQGKIIII